MLLSRLLPNKKIKDIEGEIIDDCGSLMFKINTLIFDDDTQLQIEGDYGASCVLTDFPNNHFLEQQIKQVFDERQAKKQ